MSSGGIGVKIPGFFNASTLCPMGFSNLVGGVSSNNTLLLDGSTQYGQISADASMTTARVSYSFWFNIDASASGDQKRIFDKFKSGGARAFFAWNSATGKMRLLWKTSTSSQTASDGPTTVAKGVWTHADIDYNGSTVRLFLNNTLELTENHTGDMYANDVQTILFGDDIFLQKWFGSIAAFNVWNRSKTDDERTENFNGDKGLQFNNMSDDLKIGNVCSIPFNNGVTPGQEFLDQSGNGNDAVMTGSPSITTPTLDFS